MSSKTDHFIVLFLSAGILVAGGLASAQEGSSIDPDYEPPRTAFGHPDLQAVWSNAILTPLERPPEFADQAFLSEEQANAYREQRLEVFERGERQDNAELDVAFAYNDFWWDWG